MRSEKVITNSAWGMAYKLITILLGFVGRTFFIRYLGAEYLGISGLFSNVLTMLSLSELGFSTAITFHLYKLLAQDDREAIAGIMNFYKWVYRFVAAFIAVAGLVLLPFLPKIVGESSFSFSYVRAVYLIYLFKSACSYLFSYNFTIATADQKNYLLTKIDIVMHILTSVLNIVVLVLFRNYIVYLVVEILLLMVSNIIKSIRVQKVYPYIRSKAKILPEKRKSILKDVGNVFMGKVATVVVTSTDNIIISSAISIAVVGYYSNYSMIISYVQMFLTQITSAIQAGLGNLLATEEKSYSYRVLMRTTILLHFLASFCAVCLYVLLTPFVNIWLGEAYLLDDITVFLCVLSFYLQIIKGPLWSAVSGAGLFREDRNIAIYGAVSNLVVSIICVNLWGLPGVFFGTVFSQATQWLFKTKILIRDYLEVRSYGFIGMGAALTLLTMGMCIGIPFVADLLQIANPYVDFVARGALCVFVSVGVNWILLRKTDAYRYGVALVKNKLSRVISKNNLRY